MAKIYIVTGVWDANTIEVFPEWEFEGKRGNLVHARGYIAPQSGKAAMGFEQRLSALLLNRNIELHSPEGIQRNRLISTIFYNNINLADYFTEYKERVSGEPENEQDQELQSNTNMETESDSGKPQEKG